MLPRGGMIDGLVGMDIGTTACKGALLAEASAAQPEYAPHPGWAEADAGAWWANGCAVMRALMAQMPR